MENYEKDDRVIFLIKNINIYIMFIMNFDGFENVREGECSGEKGRGNVNLVDLNRNFLD